MKRAKSRGRSSAGTVAVAVGGAVLGAGLLVLAQRLRPDVEEWIGQNPSERGRLVIAGLIALTLPVFVVAAYLWRAADRTHRAGLLRTLAVTLAVAAVALITLLARMATMIDARS
jgi:hypothetical protein